MRILHVTECMAGGVQTAIGSYVKATPELDHMVVANSRRGHNLTMGNIEGSSRLFLLPTSHVAAIRKVAALVKESKPDVLHAHSSFAGIYSRIATLWSNTPVVYTPHALAFGRPDFSKSKRNAFKLIEKIFSLNTAVFAGCSVHESKLLTQLNKGIPVVTIPNALSPDHPTTKYKWTRPLNQKVGMVGRINEYRDPSMFIAVTEAVRAIRPEVEFEWIGDGDDAQRETLKAAGVHVTGWLSGVELQKKITELSVLLYTSKWDGFPMVILEAISSNVPTFVSNIAPLEECPAAARFDTAEQATDLVIKQLEHNQPLASYWGPLKAQHSFSQQQQALLHTYEIATGQ